MSIRITCPSCRSSYTVADDLLGKKIRCRKCEGVVPVRSDSDDEGEEEDRPRPQRRIPAQPTRSDSVRRSRDEVDVPRRRPPRSRDEEDDEAPRRKKVAQGGLKPIVLILGSCGILLVGVLAAAVVYLRTPQAAVNQPPGGVTTQPIPGAGQLMAATLDAASLDRAKKATVYLRVELPTGGVAEGTGFFAVEPGIIVTNAHVLGMLSPDSVIPRSVTVAVHSGEPSGFRLQGVVLGVDRINDLAVLRVEAGGGQLPAPLQIRSATDLMETQKVFIFGFPLGAQLGKNITVSESSVSSLRRSESGVLRQVQVNGGMHPGNSGGPVTNSNGVAVGVSVAGIPGTQINFAIPAEFVSQAIEGQFSGHEFGTPYVSAGRTHLPVQFTTLDPLARVREVKLDVWTGNAGAARQDSAEQPGDGPRQRVGATRRAGAYTAEVPLPALVAGQVYWLQPVLVTGAGVSRFGAAQPVPFQQVMVLNRTPVQIGFKAPTGPTQRTLHMTNNATMTIFRGRDSVAMSQKMDGYVLEALKVDTRGLGTGIDLTLARPEFTRESAGRKLVAPPELATYLSRFSPSFLVDANNRAKERGNRSFASIPPAHREAVEELFESVCNTWEVTTLPLPNRTMRPNENWPARVPMLVLVEGKREVQFLNLTCTYEGVRTVGDRTQAFVRLAGVVKGRGAHAEVVLGKVAGHALVDVEKGFLSQVKTTISCEVETDNADVRVLVTDESVVDRVEGNTQDIKVGGRRP